MESGTLEGLDMWRQFHTEDFDPEEVHFTFETTPTNDPEEHARDPCDATRPRARTTTSSIHEGPSPEAALKA